jgi:hypothetical protein
MIFKLYRFWFSFVLLFCSVDATAHVKWFSEYDTSAAPRALADVLTLPFIAITLLSCLLVFMLSYLDSSRFGESLKLYFNRLVSQTLTVSRQYFCTSAIRYGLIVFFTAIWALGSIILTPELRYEDNWLIGSLHILIIVSLMFKPTTIISGACLLLLWLTGVVQYGFFHLADYTIFIGIAIFLILIAYNQPVVQRSAFVLLFAAISITLQWASIEKFVYPEWTFPILSERPHLSMGLDRETFMIIAGVVEFLLAFLLISTRSVSFLLAAIGLAVVFLLAIIDFGKVDAIGHLGIIVCLFVMTIYGPTGLNHRLSNLHKNIKLNALLVTCLYFFSLCLFFGLYYGTRYVWLSMPSSGWLLGVLTLAFIGIGITAVIYRSTGKNFIFNFTTVPLEEIKKG